MLSYGWLSIRPLLIALYINIPRQSCRMQFQGPNNCTSVSGYKVLAFFATLIIKLIPKREAPRYQGVNSPAALMLLLFSGLWWLCWALLSRYIRLFMEMKLLHLCLHDPQPVAWQLELSLLLCILKTLNRYPFNN